MSVFVRWSFAALSLAGVLANVSSAVTAAPPAPVAQTGGVATLPDFTGSGQKYWRFRTAIRDEYANGINFDQNYRLIIIGCGESCVTAWLADMRTGKLSDFPISGFDYFELHLAFTPDSPVVSATWQQQTPTVRCVTRHFALAGGAFRITRPDDVHFAECPPF